jgi:hypothetical protein
MLLRLGAIGVGGALVATGVALGITELFVRIASQSWRAPSILDLAWAGAAALGVDVARARAAWPPALDFVLRLADVVPSFVLLLPLGTWALWASLPDPRPIPPDFVALARRLERELDHQGPCLVVVSRQWPSLLEYLKGRFRNRAGIEVVMDRRWGQRRRREEWPVHETRRDDRRRQRDETGPLDWEEQVRIIRRDGGPA